MICCARCAYSYQDCYKTCGSCKEEVEIRTKAALWDFYSNCPQTALMLGSKLDPNDETVDWKEECTKLALKNMEE